MKKSRAIFGCFSKLSNANMEVKAQVILAGMTDNPNFPTPSPALTVVATALQNYSDALSSAVSGDKLKRAERNDRRLELKAVLLDLGSYVNHTAAGDRTKLISTHFDVNKERSGPQPLPDPKNFKAELGKNTGEMLLSVNKVRGAKSYAFQCTASPVTKDSIWVSVFSSTRTATITGLEPAVIYCFRIVITGPNSQVVTTDIISKMAY